MTFSRRDAEALARFHHVDPSQITVARPGVDLRRFAPAADAAPHAAESPLRVIFAGHNFRLKGLARVLDTIARARAPMTLTVAGGGVRLPFAWRARLRGLSDRVEFCGNLSQDELAERFRMSDVLLHPAYYDPFPRAIVEAMACGCVPIVTRQCGVSEVLSAGIDGFVAARPGAVDEMAGWLDALQDPELRTAMRGAAIRRARALDFESHADLVASWLAHGPEASGRSTAAARRTAPAGRD
jgi:glycosyltransferase involved in cell wall biosynthesis